MPACHIRVIVVGNILEISKPCCDAKELYEKSPMRFQCQCLFIEGFKLLGIEVLSLHLDEICPEIVYHMFDCWYLKCEVLCT